MSIQAFTSGTALVCILTEPLARWTQSYDPAHHWLLSAVWAAVPLCVLLLTMGVFRIKGHLAALAGLFTAFLIAVGMFHLPIKMSLLATGYGAAYGLFPIAWIVFPVLFLYQLTHRSGSFTLLQQSLVGVTQDSRLQLLLIAFAFGAFFEGSAGFGTPVAICATILIGLGFPPLQAAGLSLLANTAPVAFGGLGIPMVALHGITGLDTLLLSRVAARMIAPFCILVPFWLICAYAGWAAMLEIWPAILVAGGVYSLTLLLVATLHGPWLVDIFSSSFTIIALLVLLRVWKPRRSLSPTLQVISPTARTSIKRQDGFLRQAIMPWAILSLFIVLWGLPKWSQWLDSVSSIRIPVTGLHQVVWRMPPAVPAPVAESAVFNFNWLSATGTGIFIAAIVAGFAMGIRPSVIVRTCGETFVSMRFTFITIAALMALGFVTRYAGMDATLGLAFARTGHLYPFFGTLIGWIGTASTGSDTSSNVLFGSLQKLTAQQLGISAYLMAAANSAGGVMGKMIAPQSIVVATTATDHYGKEGTLLRFVILHSLALACLAGLLVLLYTSVPAITNLVLR
ncbi:L-lactate permease [Edaphobacter sp. HDX4]|uniref:L-lactate permease n=1 Tax=Edaphobacter sp. HDX4 TaxID=2794064 RepID=UPI002FE506D7